MTQTDIVAPIGRAGDPSRPGPTGTAAPRWWRRPWIVPLVVVVVVFIVVQMMPFARAGLDETAAPIPSHDGFPLYYPLLLIHIVLGTVAMLTVVLQVWPWVRLNHPAVHRASGRTYVVAALFTGVIGLVLAPFAPTTGKVGVVGATLAWLIATAIGFRMARKRRWVLHRRFMLYSFAIVMNNLWGVAIVGIGLPLQVELAYLIESARWAGWVVNLALVQWWLYHTAERPIAFASSRPR